MDDAQAAKALAELRRHRRLARRQPYRHSKLDRYRAELVLLRNQSASYPELADWLRRRKRLRVSHSTILRRMRQWPEVNQ